MDFLISPHRVFVNARPRAQIMQNMRERISRGDIEAERSEAIQVSLRPLLPQRKSCKLGEFSHGTSGLTVRKAMCAIARDRAEKLASPI